MKHFPALSGLLLILALCFPQHDCLAQHREGTIEASWERAESRTRVTHERRPSEDYRSMETQRSDQRGNVWDTGRTPESRPWPKLPEHPGAHDYFEANTALIDSLNNLYCLSANYIQTLQTRNNDAIHSPEGVEPRQFTYDAARKTDIESYRVSLQALHKELQQLLDRCLTGR